MIQFTKLVINNFLSWGENQVILLHEQGVVRIEGKNLDEPSADSNMVGKSSILEAILWCLYARTIRNVKHDAVVNRFSTGDCYVSLFFRDGDIHYRASRYRRHRKHKNRLLLWRGERTLTYRHNEDTQAKLEQILGCDYDSFTHTTIFGGPRPFALLTDAEQKEVLESFLHFEKFEIALRRTKQLLSEAVERRHDLELRTVKARGDIQEIRGRLGSLSRAEEVGRRERDQERTRIKKRLKKLVEPKLGPSEKELEEAGEVVEALVTSLAKAGTRRKTLRQRLEALASSVRGREKLIGKPCPVCGQRVVATSVEAFLVHVYRDERSLRGELKKSRGKVEMLERRLVYARKELKRVQSKKDRSSKENLRYVTRKRELELALSRLGKVSSTPFTSEIQRLSLKYSKTMSRLLVLKFEESSLKQSIRDLTFWVSGFGNKGVKSLIIKEALPAMNQKLTEYAEEIYGGTAKIKFSTTKTNRREEERELFHLRYKSRFGSDTYLGESSGGRRRVDICVLLVFSWLSSTCNLLVVDELLDNLDSSGRERILDILSRLRGTILVISHEKELKAHFHKVWTVVKRKGIAHLEKAA
jgi:DNA repair exonuclease SbcCD ATPase subunit